MSLHQHRQYHASGPQPISHTDIRCFLHDSNDIPTEVIPKFKQIVSSLDVVYLNYYNEKHK